MHQGKLIICPNRMFNLSSFFLGVPRAYCSFGFFFSVFQALTLYGSFVMRGIIEDKNSRVIEIVVSSVKPFQLMAGKIIGIGAVSLTQLIIWAVLITLASVYGLFIVKQLNPGISAMPLPSISIWIYLSFMIYFILGYFLYATLYAAIGSMANSESEAQSLQAPVAIFLVISFLLMFTVFENSDGSLATILSLIPFFSPILMFYRVSVHSAPIAQVIISIVFLLATIWGAIWVTGRIFRVGILMYGKRPTLPELMKWIRF